MAKLKKVWSGKFTMISNEIFDDWRLSYKEIGLYCNMMKFPDDWDFSIRNLADRHKEKRDAVKTGIDHLLEIGYISREERQNRREKGRFGSFDYVIYEDPHDNPNFIPCPGVNRPERLSEPPYTDYPYTDEPHTDNPYTENPYTVEPYTENPCTAEPYTDNPTTTNTVFKNTVYTKTNEEEEDVTRASADPELFRDKVKSRFMSRYFSRSNDEVAQSEMTKALNAILNALPDIKGEKAIQAVNDCSREEASDLWDWVYRKMFCTDTGEITRDDIQDKHAYLVKIIPNQLGTSYGPDPMESWGIH